MSKKQDVFIVTLKLVAEPGTTVKDVKNRIEAVWGDFRSGQDEFVVKSIHVEKENEK